MAREEPPQLLSRVLQSLSTLVALLIARVATLLQLASPLVLLVAWLSLSADLLNLANIDGSEVRRAASLSAGVIIFWCQTLPMFQNTFSFFSSGYESLFNNARKQKRAVRLKLSGIEENRFAIEISLDRASNLYISTVKAFA